MRRLARPLAPAVSPETQIASGTKWAGQLTGNCHARMVAIRLKVAIIASKPASNSDMGNLRLPGRSTESSAPPDPFPRAAAGALRRGDHPPGRYFARFHLRCERRPQPLKKPRPSSSQNALPFDLNAPHDRGTKKR